MATRYNSEGGGEEGDLFLWIINGTIFVLIKNNLSFLRKFNWRYNVVMIFFYFLYEI